MSLQPPASRSLRGFSRRAFLGLLGLAGGATLSGRPPAGRPTDEDAAPPEVIDQKPIGDMACGPCALANALTHGDAACRRAFAGLEGDTPLERVAALIAQVGDNPSETYEGRRARYSRTDGTPSNDMPFMANDFFASADLPAVRGEWLDLRENEDARAHLRRVHGVFAAALASGLPAVVEVRSFGANTTDPKTPVWNGLMGHWMAVVGLEPAVLAPKATGFVCRFADSATGEVISGFAYAETHRAFVSTHGFTLKEDGTKSWEWIKGHPYILLQAPDLGLKTQERLWHERTYFSLSYAVSRAGAGRGESSGMRG